MRPPVLSARDLAIDVVSEDGDRHSVLRGVDFDIEAGSIAALVGRSGSGKTLTALAILGLLPAGVSASGRIVLGGENLLGPSAVDLGRIRGRRIGAIFQEPMSALNPVLTIGEQIMEVLQRHLAMRRLEARREAERLLDRVAMPGGTERLAAYPHQLSGGQQQRAMIAAAVAARPELLIADEPTTALDVTTQAQILGLLEELARDLGLSALLISHDPAVVARSCDRLHILEEGRIVESGRTEELFRRPAHPATRRLVEATRRLHGGRASRESRPGATVFGSETPRDLDRKRPGLVRISGLHKSFPMRRGLLQREIGRAVVVDGVDLEIGEAECLAVVGESGSGKTTLAHCVAQLVEASAGTVEVDGEGLGSLPKSRARRKRQDYQVIFQDPAGSLNPRRRVGRSIAEPLELHTSLDAAGRGQRVADLLEAVDLSPSLMDRWPHELSTGQKQRVGIARAIASRPRFLIADEPLSALDVTLRAEMLELLEQLRRELGLAILLISHDLGLVRDIADRIAVMYCGRIVEQGPTADLLAAPLHPYTVSLLASIPNPDPAATPAPSPLAGEPPDPVHLPHGCCFHPRCAIAEERCRLETPRSSEATAGHGAACIRPGELQLSAPANRDNGTF